AAAEAARGQGAGSLRIRHDGRQRRQARAREGERRGVRHREALHGGILRARAASRPRLIAAVSPFVLPEAAHLRAYFEMLFGEGVHVRAGERESPDASWYGVFRDDAGTAVAVCVCDIDFGAYAGAALSMLMPNDARAAVRNGAISEVMRANLYEIMNILSSLLMNDHTPHLRLREMSTG